MPSKTFRDKTTDGKFTEKDHKLCVCVCVTHCVSVHETPNCGSHLTSKEDHQEEEELKKDNDARLKSISLITTNQYI